MQVWRICHILHSSALPSVEGAINGSALPRAEGAHFGYRYGSNVVNVEKR
jgi:hypothetical protein